MIFVFKNDLPSTINLPGDIAIDTETMGLNISRDRLCVLQLTNGDGNIYLVHFDGSDYRAPNLKAILSDNSSTKIFHYARFDLAVIEYYLDISIQENIFCTKVASKIARTYTEYHGLKNLCNELLGINLSKQMQASFWGTQSLSEEQKEYAARDVIYLHKLKEALINLLTRENRIELAMEAFKIIPFKVKLDLLGWGEVDIFSH